jgi:myo-inositol-1(or 4)-monophosphatase
VTPSTPDVAARQALARDVIGEAGDLALDYFARRDQLLTREKGPHDLVTEADAAVEALIMNRIVSRFPSDSLLGEETGFTQHGVDGGALWVVDPIDGTQEFWRGTRSWCIVIALVVSDRVEFGLVLNPNDGELFEARRGQGATLNGTPIAVSRAGSLADGLVSVEVSSRNRVDDVIGILRRLLETGGSYTRSGSGALQLCYVACGRSLGFVELHMYAWDCLAALLIVTEAGGRATDFIAEGSLRTGGRVVAAAPQLFESVLALMPSATALARVRSNPAPSRSVSG